MSWRSAILRSGAAALISIALFLTQAAAAADAPSAEDLRIAQSLAIMLQSSRAVVSAHQSEINDPSKGDKGLTSKKVLDETIANYRKKTGVDPLTIDPASYEGRLLKAQMDAVVEVMDKNQALVNAEGVGFKGFIPSTFARLVNEAFGRRTGGEATVKNTAPPDLVRNRQTRPDEWELAAIKDYLRQPEGPRGPPHSGIDPASGAPRVRVMVPEYYSKSCLTCHGEPKGELDMTGYAKEGAHENDLGGVISIELTPQ